MEPSSPAPAKPARLMSLDAYRGFIMLAMASSFGSALVRVSRNLDGLWSLNYLPLLTAPEGQGSLRATTTLAASLAQWWHGSFFEGLKFQFEHVAWTGCSFWDLIQPSFMFMVGVAMPYSYASRKAKGDSQEKIFLHTLIRSFILIALGVFLSSNGRSETNYTFVNVLTQIGLGYTFVFLFLGRGLKTQLLSAAAILVGYWALFAAWPLPSDSVDWSALKVGADERFRGFFAHWDKNANVAHEFDLWFLNLFPRSAPFKYNEGGYQTLNFVPSMATILFGLMAGELLRSSRSAGKKFMILVAAGVFSLGLGLLLDKTVCPSVKRIWTPSWAIYSSGWTFLMLAGFYGVIDIAGFRRWAFALVVVGMNSIAMYCMAQLLGPWTRQMLETHLGRGTFSGVYGPLISMAGVLAVYWLICWWMYRQRTFIRI